MHESSDCLQQPQGDANVSKDLTTSKVITKRNDRSEIPSSEDAMVPSCSKYSSSESRARLHSEVARRSNSRKLTSTKPRRKAEMPRRDVEHKGSDVKTELSRRDKTHRGSGVKEPVRNKPANMQSKNTVARSPLVITFTDFLGSLSFCNRCSLTVKC